MTSFTLVCFESAGFLVGGDWSVCFGGLGPLLEPGGGYTPAVFVFFCFLRPHVTCGQRCCDWVLGGSDL